MALEFSTRGPRITQRSACVGGSVTAKVIIQKLVVAVALVDTVADDCRATTRGGTLCPGYWDRRSSPSDDAVCTSLAQSRVEDRGLGQETREINDQFWDILGGATQSGALPRVASSKCLTSKSTQGTFRAADSVTEDRQSPGDSAGAMNSVDPRFQTV